MSLCRSAALSYACLLLCLLSAVSPLFGQKRSKAEIVITRIKCDSVRSPDYKDSKDAPREFWGQFSARFDVKKAGTRDKWLDEMTVVWKILATDRDGNTKLMSIEIPYEDIEEGSDRRVCMYLKPQFMRRYMNSGGRFLPGSYSYYCEIQIDGQRVASKELTISKHHGFGKWYLKDSDRSRGERYLIPKSRSPFSVIDYDSYECEKISK